MNFKGWMITLALVAFGTSDVIILKLTDKQKSVGIDGGAERKFKQPLIQSLELFVGQIVILMIISYLRRRQWQSEASHDAVAPVKRLEAPWTVFILPGICVVIAVSLELWGLQFIYASIFQIVRGSQIVFTASFSVCECHACGLLLTHFCCMQC